MVCWRMANINRSFSAQEETQRWVIMYRPRPPNSPWHLIGSLNNLRPVPAVQHNMKLLITNLVLRIGSGFFAGELWNMNKRSCKRIWRTRRGFKGFNNSWWRWWWNLLQNSHLLPPKVRIFKMNSIPMGYLDRKSIYTW